jgi:hypothetical protein
VASLLASESGDFLGFIALLALIVGVAGTIALFVFFMRHAPPDGSDPGFAPDDQDPDRP